MKAILKIAGILYFILLFYIFFLARRRGRPHLFGGERPLHLVPLKEKINYLTNAPGSTIRNDWRFLTDLFGNILLFIPFVFFLVFAYNIQNLKKVVLISLVTSLIVETIQYILHIGIADIDDVILNAMGACTGAFLIWLLRKSSHPVIQKSSLLSTSE